MLAKKSQSDNIGSEQATTADIYDMITPVIFVILLLCL